MRILSTTILVSCATILLLTSRSTSSLPAREKKPRNVILVIGDGMGPQQLGLAGLYNLKTKDDKAAPLSRFIGRSTIGTHLPSGEGTLVNDSACSGTQMASACLCRPRQVGLDAKGLPCGTIFKDAKKRSMKVGLVSDTQITHATPAAFYARVDERSSEHLIAEQFLESGIDVALSGGRAFFLPTEASCNSTDCRFGKDGFGERTDGLHLLAKARSQGFVVTQSAQELAEARSTPLLGLFSPNFMNDAFREGQDQQPTLAAMTAKALSLLENTHGFILVVEAGQIDLAAHHNDAGWVLAELFRLSRTLDVIEDFAERRNDTLIILTGDHETGGMGFSYSYPRNNRSTHQSFSSTPQSTDTNFVSTDRLDTLARQRAPVRLAIEAFMKLNASQRTAAKLQEVTLSTANLQLDSEVASLFAELLNGKPRSTTVFDLLTSSYYPLSSAPTALLGRALGAQIGIVWATGTHTSTPIFVFSTGPHSSSFRGVFQTHELGQRLKTLLGG